MKILTHICYVIWKFSSPKKFSEMGGAENQLLKIVKESKKKGNIHITIISRKMKSDPKEEAISKNKKISRINTINIPLLSMILFMVILFFKIIKLNKRKKIDLIHVPLADIFIFVLYALRFLLKIPVIIRVAGDELYPFRKHGFWLFNRLVVRALMLKSDGLQVLNPIAYNIAIKLGFQSDKLHLIPNGTTIPSKCRDYRNFTNTIIYIGAMRFYSKKNIKEQKNLAFLIRAFYNLTKSNHELKLVMVGDGNYKTDLEKLVKKLAIHDKVIFTGYQTEIGKYLQSADIFVNPSWFEGMPNTVIEAMASGIFVLCSDIPEHRFIIKNQYNGVLFDHTKEEDFVRAINAFYLDKEKSKQIARNGRNHIKENFSMNKITRLIFKMYDDVITCLL